MKRDGEKPHMTARAQALRRNMTPQERRLWYDFLRSYRLQWRRQHPIGGYIADFYCPVIKLAVEVDGAQHFEPAAAVYDRERTQYLQAKGIRVLRFTNYEVDRAFDAVCAAIHQAALQLELQHLEHKL